MKRILCGLLSFIMFCSLISPAYAVGLSNFSKVNSYTQGQFSDVLSTNWCAENVKSAYEYGMMNGKDSNIFDPNGAITLAEALTLASRMHSIYYGNKISSGNDGYWYSPYVSYASKNNIYKNTALQNPDYNASINRLQFAGILGAALPDESLPAINYIEDGAIPDISSDSNYSEAVYRLYRAGILTGSNEKGAFLPESGISRGEAAALISRMIEPDLRKHFTLEIEPFNPVPLNSLVNLRSLRKNATDAQLAEAYEIAVELVRPYAKLSTEEKLFYVMLVLRLYFESNMDYSMQTPHYNDPYGYFVLCSASCAGCTRATGMCLNILGIPYEHVNENKYSHQWCRVNVDGTYWICDPYGLYCGPEPAPYHHPFM